MNTTKQNNQQKDDESSSQQNPESSGDEPPGSDLKVQAEESSHWSIILEGEWKEVTGACADFTDKLEKAHTPEDQSEVERLQEWAKWSPRKEDDEKELVKRTATQARYEPDKSPSEHLEESKSHLNSFHEKLFSQNKSPHLPELNKSFKRAIIALASFLGFSLGKLEEFLYRNVILRTNPFYFDNSLISASFEKINRFEVNGEDRFKLKVKIHDTETKEDF